MQAASFQLDSKTLEKKTDFFSKLDKKKKFKELDELIKSCQSSKDKKCFKSAQIIYIDPQFVFFRNLVSELSVNAAVNRRLPISRLSFLNKSEIKEKELSRIFKHYSARDTESFFGKDYFLLSATLKKVFSKNVQLLCKYSGKQELVEGVLKALPQQEDFLSKDFAKFPCGLTLEGDLEALGKEIRLSKGRGFLKENYSFEFLKKKVLNAQYRSFPKYKKRTLKYRKRKIWARLLESNEALQEKVVKNLFYKGEYELLSHASAVSESKIKKLHAGALQYVVKSLVALGKYGDVLKVSSHIVEGKSKAFEEVKLMRGNAYLRQGQASKAEFEYREALKNTVNLELSLLYWLRVSLRLQGKKNSVQKIGKRILGSYPFSYYGILIARESKGDLFFSGYKKENFIKQTFVNTVSPEEEARLKFYYSYGHKRYFNKTFKGIEPKLNPLQKALFALVFKNLEDQLEIIRSLNLAWDLDEQIRTEPFVSSSFPMPFQKEMKKALKSSSSYINDALVYAIMRQESAFGTAARSPSGARGLMQLLPSTARDVARQIRYKGYRKANDLYKPGVNIFLGSRYIDRLIKAGKGYLPYAFASYNAGPGRMYKWSKFRTEITDLRQGLKKEGFNPIDELWIEELPWSETRFYTKALLRNMGIYVALKGKQNAFSCTPFWACNEKKL
ncbi:MAG: lytic transglycosylase domain-containing protein [Bdellovibrionales bacterium]